MDLAQTRQQYHVVGLLKATVVTVHPVDTRMPGLRRRQQQLLLLLRRRGRQPQYRDLEHGSSIMVGVNGLNTDTLTIELLRMHSRRIVTEGAVPHIASVSVAPGMLYISARWSRKTQCLEIVVQFEDESWEVLPPPLPPRNLLVIQK